MEWVSFLSGMSDFADAATWPSHQLFASVLARLLQQTAGSQGPGTAPSCFCGVPGANIFIRALFRYDSVPQNSPTYNTIQWFLVDPELCKRHHSQFGSISVLPKGNLTPISRHYPSPPPVAGNHTCTSCVCGFDASGQYIETESRTQCF